MKTYKDMSDFGHMTDDEVLNEFMNAIYFYKQKKEPIGIELLDEVARRFDDLIKENEDLYNRW